MLIVFNKVLILNITKKYSGVESLYIKSGSNIELEHILVVDYRFYSRSDYIYSTPIQYTPYAKI